MKRSLGARFRAILALLELALLGGFQVRALPTPPGGIPPPQLYFDVVVSVTGIQNGDESVVSATRAGYIAGIAVYETPTVCPRGRYYATLALFPQSSIRVNLWSGYVQSFAAGEGSVSAPGIYTPAGINLALAVAGGSKGSSGHTIVAQLVYSEQPVAGGFFFNEPPGQGPGELLELTIGNPSAGTDVVFGTVPAYVRWRPLSAAAKLTTSGTAANRQPALILTDSSGNILAAGCVNTAVQAASLAVSWSWVRGANFGNQTIVASMVVASTMPDFPDGIPTTFIVKSLTLNLQAGDQWSACFAFVEEWAFPEDD